MTEISDRTLHGVVELCGPSIWYHRGFCCAKGCHCLQTFSGRLCFHVFQRGYLGVRVSQCRKPRVPNHSGMIPNSLVKYLFLVLYQAFWYDTKTPKMVQYQNRSRQEFNGQLWTCVQHVRPFTATTIWKNMRLLFACCKQLFWPLTATTKCYINSCRHTNSHLRQHIKATTRICFQSCRPFHGNVPMANHDVSICSLFTAASKCNINILFFKIVQPATAANGLISLFVSILSIAHRNKQMQYHWFVSPNVPSTATHTCNVISLVS